MLFSEPKILNLVLSNVQPYRAAAVSVLFSEPKILNDIALLRSAMTERGFSALQRAENSQSERLTIKRVGRAGFSALQRAENSQSCPISLNPSAPARFSALQRAENSQCIDLAEPSVDLRREFQCSSASRKFSMHRRPPTSAQTVRVSVLFSEPKILNQY